MSVTTIQWYNENKLRRYPFNEAITLVADNGQQPPDSLLVDASFTVSEEHADMYCSFIKVSENLITLAFVSSAAPLLVGTFNTSSIQPYVAYPLTPMMSKVSGWIVFGDAAIPPGTYQFSSTEQGQLSQRVVNCIEPARVTSTVRFGSPLSTKLTGLIKLRSGGGVRLTKHETLPNTVILSLENPLSFVGPCNDLIDIDSTKVSVHSINKVKPDDDGLLTMIFT
ncbi:hypothetical protein ACFLQL_00295 [Verrucomicrobiota bacterium]